MARVFGNRKEVIELLGGEKAASVAGETDKTRQPRERLSFIN